MTGPPQLYGLTGARGIAALFVFSLHLDQNLDGAVSHYLPIIRYGYFGVDFFFLLSGFILSHVYLACSGDARSVFQFFRHRVARLFPLHVTVLAAVVAIVLVAQWSGVQLNYPERWRLAELPLNFALLQAWGFTDEIGWNTPAWSISVEIFAYLLFPAVAFAARRIVSVRWSVGAAMLVGAAIIAGFSWVWPIATSISGVSALTRGAGEFVVGVLIYRSMTLAGLLGGMQFGILGRGPLLWLGEISYSLYLIHWPVLLFGKRGLDLYGYATWPIVGKVASISLLCTSIFVLSLFSYNFIERPARRFVNRSAALKSSWSIG